MAQSVVRGNYFLSKKNSMRLLYIPFAKKKQASTARMPICQRGRHL